MHYKMHYIHIVHNILYTHSCTDTHRHTHTHRQHTTNTNTGFSGVYMITYMNSIYVSKSEQGILEKWIKIGLVYNYTMAKANKQTISGSLLYVQLKWYSIL
jgi:hypothetical protein